MCVGTPVVQAGDSRECDLKTKESLQRTWAVRAFTSSEGFPSERVLHCEGEARSLIFLSLGLGRSLHVQGELVQTQKLQNERLAQTEGLQFLFLLQLS